MTNDLFNRIAHVLAIPTGAPGHVPGWCDLEKAINLASVIVALRPKIVLEIGVFGGRSLIPMAMACQALGEGRVIGIDPWSPKASVEGYSGDNAKWWGELDHEGLYQAFLTNLRELGLLPHVQVVRAKSDDVHPEMLDVLHIDGLHTEQAIRDAKRFGEAVRAGGFVAVDDTGWVNNGVAHVSMAVDELLKLGFVRLYNVGTGAMFQRVKV